MKILDRYITKAFFVNYIVCLFVMIGMYVILDLFVNLDEFTKDPTEPALQTAIKIIRFYGYNTFWYFAQLAGVVTLAAACFTLARFHRTNEFTAVLASGTSLYRVAAPILITALAMNGLWFANQELILPQIADKLARRHDDIEGRQTFGIWFRPDRDNALLSAVQFSPRSQEMQYLTVMKRDRSGRMTEVVLADMARWDDTRQAWILDKGFEMKLEAETEAEMDTLGRQPMTVYPSDLTPKELALQQAAQWTSFISLPHLNRLQQRYPQVADFIRVKHTRLTTVIINMVLLCLGIPFFLNRERTPVLIAGGKCLLACGACYVVTFFCQSVDLSALNLNPALPAWVPVVLFAPAAVVLLDGIKT